MPAMSGVAALASAYEQSLQAFVLLGDQFDEAEWQAPTPCPTWSVADIYAHIVGPEKWFAEGGSPYEGSTQEWIDSHVDAYRGYPAEALMAELRAVIGVRRQQLAEAETQPTVFIPLFHAYGPHEIGLRFRLFDLWTHEQDVRVAVKRPGNLATPSARTAQEILISSLPKSIAKTAGAPPGSTVRLTVRGELPFDVAVAVDESGKGAFVPAGDADLHLTMDWADFARIGAGRGEVGDHAVEVAGPAAAELGPRVLGALNVAP